MTVVDIDYLLTRIKDNAEKDPETAHIYKDDLYRGTLQTIANCRVFSCSICHELAGRALKAEDIEMKWKACS